MKTKSSPGASRRPKSKHSRHRFTRKSVLKMLAVMSEETPDPKDISQDFLTTGRVGRRNAMADILSEHALTTTSDLPEKLKSLTTKDTNDRKESEETVTQEMSPGEGPSSSKS